jgi:hypothetical protein
MDLKAPEDFDFGYSRVGEAGRRALFRILYSYDSYYIMEWVKIPQIQPGAFGQIQ